MLTMSLMRIALGPLLNPVLILCEYISRVLWSTSLARFIKYSVFHFEDTLQLD